MDGVTSWEEKRRRVEAARAWAEIGSQDELGDLIGWRAPKLRRYLGGEGDLDVSTLTKIGEVCGVPAWFMLAGWEGATAQAGDGDGREAPEDVVADLRAETERDEGKDAPSGSQGADG